MKEEFKMEANNNQGENLTVEEGKENYLEKLLENEGCFFDSERKFTQEDLVRLAALERDFTKEEEKKEWPIEKEKERCNLRKCLEKEIFFKTPEGVEKYWKNNESEYKDNFGRGRKEEGENSFESLKHGILNEIIANKILEKFPGFQFKMTSSEIDIYQKIDILGYSDKEKTVFAIQVKRGSIRNIGERGKKKSEKEIKEGLVQEISSEGEEPRKNEFLKGCSGLEKNLLSEDPDIVVKKIWIVIPSEYKTGEGGNYNHKLEKIILERIGEIRGSFRD